MSYVSRGRFVSAGGGVVANPILADGRSTGLKLEVISIVCRREVSCALASGDDKPKDAAIRITNADLIFIFVVIGRIMMISLMRDR
jgi:hypothetical protein